MRRELLDPPPESTEVDNPAHPGRARRGAEIRGSPPIFLLEKRSAVYLATPPAAANPASAAAIAAFARGPFSRAAVCEKSATPS